MATLDSALLNRASTRNALPEESQPRLALIFAVDEGLYAIPLAEVSEVTPAAALMSPSGRESTLVGYLDLRGEVLPVLGARELLARPPRPLGLTDHLVIVRTSQRRAAILVDRVDGVEAVALVGESGPDRRDGLTLGRRTGTAEGQALVAVIDLDRLEAGPDAPRTNASAS